MGKLLRFAGYGLAGIFGLLLFAAASIWLISSKDLKQAPQAHPEHLAQPTAAQLADAPRRARTLGCFGCHGEGLRGSKMIDDPMLATIWAPNLTEVAARSSDELLARAIRQGISDKDKPLMIMPAEAYQYLSDSDVAALIKVIRSQPRGGSKTPPSSFGPIGRVGLAMGKFKTAPVLVAEFARRQPARLGAQFEPGRHLAMVNCSGCHGAELTGQETRPGENSPDLMIVGAYDIAAFKKLLRTGVPAGGQKLQLMGEVARGDLQHLSDAEIEELHSYLVSRAKTVGR